MVCFLNQALSQLDYAYIVAPTGKVKAAADENTNSGFYLLCSSGCFSTKALPLTRHQLP